MPFIWVVRSWCSLDTFWEAIRSSKEYDIAYTKPEQVLEELQKIVAKEQGEWKDLCQSSSDLSIGDREFLVELPTVDQIKNRPFYKFLSVAASKEQFAQNWYIERLHL